MNETECGIAVLAPKPWRNRTTCPYCAGPVPGLLAACAKPDCLRRDAADTAVYERGCVEP